MIINIGAFNSSEKSRMAYLLPSAYQLKPEEQDYLIEKIREFYTNLSKKNMTFIPENLMVANL